MAYDEDLAMRVRAASAEREALSERAMFGGLAFLHHGNMAVAVSGEGGLMVRVDPHDEDELVATTDARPMEMKGRSMSGWLRVPSDAVVDDEDLSRWIDIGLGRAASLPPK